MTAPETGTTGAPDVAAPAPSAEVARLRATFAGGHSRDRSWRVAAARAGADARRAGVRVRRGAGLGPRTSGRGRLAGRPRADHEYAPAIADLLVRVLPQYLDPDAVSVVTGGTFDAAARTANRRSSSTPTRDRA